MDGTAVGFKYLYFLAPTGTALETGVLKSSLVKWVAQMTEKSFGSQSLSVPGSTLLIATCHWRLSWGFEGYLKPPVVLVQPGTLQDLPLGMVMGTEFLYSCEMRLPDAKMS